LDGVCQFHGLLYLIPGSPEDQPDASFSAADAARAALEGGHSRQDFYGFQLCDDFAGEKPLGGNKVTGIPIRRLTGRRRQQLHRLTHLQRQLRNIAGNHLLEADRNHEVNLARHDHGHGDSRRSPFRVQN